MRGFAGDASRGVEFVEADLEGGAWPLAGRQFDAVIVVHYLHRPLFPHLLAEAVAPGGVLIYETFARGNEQFGRPRNPDFLLRPRELLDAFRTCASSRSRMVWSMHRSRRWSSALPLSGLNHGRRRRSKPGAVSGRAAGVARGL